MALSDSMFLFEIIVEELKSFVVYKDFSILCQFADVFQLYLKGPNEIGTFGTKRQKKKPVKKFKDRNSKLKTNKTLNESRVTVGQSILIKNSFDSLISSMRNYPFKITLCSKHYPGHRFGSAEIPWSSSFIDYLIYENNQDSFTSVTVDGKYNIFDEITSKCMATINLKVKLSSLKYTFNTQFRTSHGQSQQTFMYNELNSSTGTVLNTVRENEWNFGDETGLIKMKYSGGKAKPAGLSRKRIKIPKKTTAKKQEVISVKERLPAVKKQQANNISIINLVKSEINLKINRQDDLIKSKSLSSIPHDSHIKPLKYILGDPKGPFGNKVYCVGYCTVQNDFSKEPSKSSKSSKESIKASQSSEKSESPSKEKYKFKLCDDQCPSKNMSIFCSPSHCSLDLPQEAAHLISIKKCENVACDSKKHREPPSPPDDKVMINLSSIQHECCNMTEKLEQVVGGMKAQMKIGNNPCFCSCECTFGFTKKTRYCSVCGGYELIGEDMSNKPGKQPPFPCPIFHKLVDKNKLKTYSSGSDSRRRADDSQRSLKLGSKSEKRSIAGDKNGESEKEHKKGKKKKKDERFKFNYGYQGIPPHIGHSQCALPCTGNLGAVPKHMGWLWTAENIPGLKFRPMWKPGATNKRVVRLLKMARHPDQVMAKKRKKEVKKRPLKRPLLVVHKKDGEYTITMETMKAYSKPRALNQHPYEDKPVVTYTIGRSEEENRERRKKKERMQRRIERDQRDFIQSAFKDMCKEICLKTYQQALGILPDSENPECTCYPAEPGADRTNLDVSCSCSEDSISLGSATDSDEWIVEFTPPNALFVPTYKGKKLQKVDNNTQYTYLDYRVKLVDRYGNPVPRFFKGPDGRQQCSDLGGFWSPDHKWLQINIDGCVAPDNRWAPYNFIGPNGEQVDAEEGKFQAANGKWLVLGIDGYVDCNGRWRFYSRPRASPKQKNTKTTIKKGDTKNVMKPEIRASEAAWSCFGDASPRELSKMGIVGHGHDRKLLIATCKQILARGEDIKIPQPSIVPRRPDSKKGKKSRSRMNGYDPRNYFAERTRCKHPVPSDKGVVAMDARGNKVYFRLKDYKNKRPNERLKYLDTQGISLSSFHVPCLNSFINSEIMKQQQRDRLNALYAQARSVTTQA